VNNLYGAAMSELLPYCDFEWMTRTEMDNIDLSSVPAGAYEVDLEYPKDLHDLHNAYPMAPERMAVEDEMLSDYARIMKTSNVKTEKLIPNLNDKKKYIVHHKNLKLYIKHGLKLTKIHHAIRFTEVAWMKEYIDFNTNMRKMATSKFEKDFFKLMNNAVFGKTMENVRKYREVKLVTSEAKLTKLVASPRFKEFRIFGESLVGVHMARKTVCLDKPIHTGFTILDISKTYMYEFHYEYMLPKYGPDRLKILMTDTDSFIYAILTEDVYQDMAADADRFDFGDYPTNHHLYSAVNKKVLGKMKDETCGAPIQEFAGLGSKMYSFRTFQNEEMKRAKGVKKATLKNDIIHQDYVQCLFGGQTMRHLMHTFRSENHDIYSLEQNKVSLRPYDDKRYLLEDGITSYAYGHYRI
jgi:hypothetical protein